MKNSYKEVVYQVSGTDVAGIKYYMNHAINMLANILEELKNKESYKEIKKGDQLIITYVETVYYIDNKWVDNKVNAAYKAIKSLDDNNTLQLMLLKFRGFYDDIELRDALREEYLKRAPMKKVKEEKTIVITKTYITRDIILF